MDAFSLPTISSLAGYLWLLFKTWIMLFISPVYPTFEPDILWIIIPVWLNFIITEIYQEREGTNFGNAIQNGLVAAFVGLDWMRSMTRAITAGTASSGAVFHIKFGLSFLVFAYGVFVVYSGIKGKRITTRIGRIRGVTYVLAVFTPAVYDLVPLTRNFFLCAILFYPIFHVLVNLIDRRFPTPAYL